MAGSLLGLQQQLRLIGGITSGSALQTELADDNAYAAFAVMLSVASSLQSILESTTAMTAIAQSDLAMEIFSSNARAMTKAAASDTITAILTNYASSAKAIVATSTTLNYWKSVTANYTRLKARVNASGSKLKREIFTSSGTFTIPGTGLKARSVVLIGSGGNGGSTTHAGTANHSAGGGGGGEVKIDTIYTGLEVANQSVTIGSGVNTTYGSLITATKGSNGTDADLTAGGTGGAGGGTTSGGGTSSITDTTFATAVWQTTTCSVAGGAGGNGYDDPVAGTSGISNGIGTGGTYAVGTAGVAGTTGSGGAGGGNASGNGSSATANTGGGGGGSGLGSGNTGGTGATGSAVVYYVEND